MVEARHRNNYEQLGVGGIKVRKVKELEYAKLILSLQILSEIERVKMCVQILKNENKDRKM